MSDEAKVEMTEEEAAEALINQERVWPITIALKYPIEMGKQNITEIVMRRGQLGWLDGIKAGETPSFDQLALIASRMSGQTIQVIKKLDMDDSAEVAKIALIFFARCLRTGAGR